MAVADCGFWNFCYRLLLPTKNIYFPIVTETVAFEGTRSLFLISKDLFKELAFTNMAPRTKLQRVKEVDGITQDIEAQTYGQFFEEHDRLGYAAVEVATASQAAGRPRASSEVHIGWSSRSGSALSLGSLGSISVEPRPPLLTLNTCSLASALFVFVTAVYTAGSASAESKCRAFGGFVDTHLFLLITGVPRYLGTCCYIPLLTLLFGSCRCQLGSKLHRWTRRYAVVGFISSLRGIPATLFQCSDPDGPLAFHLRLMFSGLFGILTLTWIGNTGINFYRNDLVADAPP